MKIMHSPLLALSLIALLAGCNPGTHVSTNKGNVASDGKVITLRADGHPDAKISADGVLTVGGKPVVVNPAQRVLLQSYRNEMNAMTADGIAIGKQGAAMAGTAVKEAIKGAINGDGEKIGNNMEAEARKIEQQAMQLCLRLVTIKASQDTLAEQLPVFKPYATIDIDDVNSCKSGHNDTYAAGQEVGASVAKAAKGEKDSAASDNDAAAAADAAAAEVEKKDASGN
jgi:DUF2884 family protein